MATQQLFLGGGKAPSTRYTDEVFHSWAYEGTDGHAITGVNSTDPDGNSVTRTLWFKKRNSAQDHYWFDSDRGHWSTGYKYIKSNSNDAEVTANSNHFTGSGFQSDGWVPSGYLTTSGDRYVNWCFQEAPGFFDTVKYTGTGNNLTITHNLGCMPGFIMVKSLDYSDYWTGFHCFDYSKHLHLVLTNDASDGNSYFYQNPTKDEIYIKNNNIVNTSGKEYIAYIWGGGKSTASTARSLYFDGSNDQLNISDHADYELGNGDFTLETWIKSTQSTSSYITALGKWKDTDSNRSWLIRYSSQDIGTGWCFFYSLNGWNYSGSDGGTVMGSDISDGQWHHIAVTRTGGNIRTFTDGILNTTVAETGTFFDGDGDVTIGGQSGNYFPGYLSNVRLIKGTALYTSTFKVPTKPLENVTNTKLLCCNNSSATGSTVVTGTITSTNAPTPYNIEEQPFFDPDGFKFGDSQEEMIKCGSYEGNGSSDGPEINLGWEPQWIMIKSADSYQNWLIWDHIRGITSDDSNVSDPMLYPNLSNAESSGIYRMRLTPRGFKLTSSNAEINTDNQTYVYVAIRRPDPRVAKEITVGTKAFAMDTGNSGALGARGFDATFPVDFATTRRPASSDNWYTSARLINGREVQLQSNGAASSQGNKAFDSNRGWHTNSGIGTDFYSWMWGRHKGFDCVTYTGSGVARQIPHSMNQIPEMIWSKRLDSTGNWYVYHKDLNNGSSPANWFLQLDTNDAQSNTAIWNQTPTADWFAASTDGHVNTYNAEYLALLFSSVTGISKCGTYAGSNSDVTVTTGFQPRFIIIKRMNAASHWAIYDTLRGINSSGSGGDYLIYPNEANAQTEETHIDLSSTSFTVKTGQWVAINAVDHNYIYYAHA